MKSFGFLVLPALACGLFVGAPAAADPFYLKGFGGFTFPQDTDVDIDLRNSEGSVPSGLDYDTGYVVGVAGGYMVAPNVALELEYAFRSTDADVKNDGPGIKTESHAFMANALYVFAPVGASGAWRPYVGGGMGVADDLNVDEIPNELGGSLDADYSFAYQFIAGVGYAVGPNWRLTGEVRYFAIDSQEISNDELYFEMDYNTFDLLVGATYAF